MPRCYFRAESVTNRDSAEAAAAGRRRTPLDPYPEPRPREAGLEDGSRPTELGADAISILDGRTFMFSDALGDVRAGSTGGLVHEDTRFLSRWELSLGGARLSLLKSSTLDYNTASFFLANTDLPDLPANSLAVRRVRLVGGGALEHLTVFNTAPESIPVELRLACGADFADLFEVRDSVRDRSANIACHSGGRSLRFRYRVPRLPRRDDDPGRAKRARRGGDEARARPGAAPNRRQRDRLGGGVTGAVRTHGAREGRRARERGVVRA